MQWWRERARREAQAQRKWRGTEEAGVKGEELGLVQNPTEMETEEYDWDDLRPLPLDGKGKVLFDVTTSQGSAEKRQRRGRRGSRRRKFVTTSGKLSHAEGRTTECHTRRVGSRGSSSAAPRDKEVLPDRSELHVEKRGVEDRKGTPMAPRLGCANDMARDEGRGTQMAPPQEYKLLPARNVLPEKYREEGNRRVPPMATRQENSSASERDGWRGQHMAPPQDCEVMLDRSVLLDAKKEGLGAPIKDGIPLPDDELAWRNLKKAVLEGDDGTAATEPMSDDEEEEENWSWMQGICAGLDPPTLWSGERVSGQNKAQHRRENKRARIAKQEAHPTASYCTRHRGDFVMPPPAGKNRTEWKGDM